MKPAVLGQIFLHPLRDLFRVRDLHTRFESERMRSISDAPQFR
jgi:hypothetical protein